MKPKTVKALKDFINQIPTEFDNEALNWVDFGPYDDLTATILNDGVIISDGAGGIIDKRGQEWM